MEIPERSVMYSEDQYIMISALQHYVFCPRQCGLIHVHQLWQENHFTSKGNVFHERVHSEECETRKEKTTERGLIIVSKRLGISGKTDAVEFVDEKDSKTILPVEYKSGKPKHDKSDEVQLCAQALCLEEMMNVEIERGALFYGETKHRVYIVFSDELRKETEDIISKVHEMVESGMVPPPKYEKKCSSCSLNNLCMPKLSGSKRLKSYIEEIYSDYEETS